MVANSASARIGIDLGGTKIEIICLSRHGESLARLRMATPRDYQQTVHAIGRLVAEVERTTGCTGTIGVGIPGAIVPSTGLVKNANATWLIGRPLQHDLTIHLSRPVRVMNDANCFVVSESADGAAAGAEVVFGVILGTGVGGGITVRGQVLNGANCIAGEWGHVQLPWMLPDEAPGSECYCGKRGCVETFLSGPAFEVAFARTTGRHLTSREIVDAASEDPVAQNAVAQYSDRLARSLAVVINVFDPDVIVLGGGMSNLPNLADNVAELLPQYAFSNTIVTRVVKNLHGDSSGVRGAAWLWAAEY